MCICSYFFCKRKALKRQDGENPEAEKPAKKHSKSKRHGATRVKSRSGKGHHGHKKHKHKHRSGDEGTTALPEVSRDKSKVVERN